MLRHIKFSLPDDYEQQQLIGDLTDHYAIKTGRTVLKSMAIYDTFDWRLFNKSLVLYASENKLLLRKLHKNDIIHSAPITSPPVFIWDFHESEFKELLAPIIKMRALFKLVEVHYRSTTHRILNQN
jgi:hypothetical protein